MEELGTLLLPRIAFADWLESLSLASAKIQRSGGILDSATSQATTHSLHLNNRLIFAKTKMGKTLSQRPIPQLTWAVIASTRQLEGSKWQRSYSQSVKKAMQSIYHAAQMEKTTMRHYLKRTLEMTRESWICSLSPKVNISASVSAEPTIAPQLKVDDSAKLTSQQDIARKLQPVK